MTQTNPGTKSFPASAALEPYRFVQLDANGRIEYCTAASSKPIGVTQDRALAIDEPVPVMLLNNGGTTFVTGVDALAINSNCYLAANGKVSDGITTGGLRVCQVLAATTADGSRVEAILRFEPTKSSQVVADSGQNTANEIDITTGFGADPSHFTWNLRAVTTGVNRETAAASAITFPSAGVVKIANANIAVGDIVDWTARP